MRRRGLQRGPMRAAKKHRRNRRGVASICPDHRYTTSNLARSGRMALAPGTPTEFNELVQSGVDAARAASSYKNKPLSLEAACSRAKDFERYT